MDLYCKSNKIQYLLVSRFFLFYNKNKEFAVLLNSFQLVNRNVNPVILKNGDGKNSLFVIQGTIIFPHSRLSSHTENKFPHSRLRRSWGNLSSVFLLSLSWGNIIVPFMTHREFLFPSLAASRLVKEISRPHFLK